MTAVILTGTSAHPGTVSLPLGGEALAWSPVQLTNYTVNLYGGPGSVETDGTSVLVNSTLDLSGANETLINTGTMVLNNSRLTIAGNLSQAGLGNNSQIDIINNGHMTIDGPVSGGGIAITSGMLEFAQSPSFMHSPETASENFHAWLALPGASAAIAFDGVSGKLSVHYNPTLDDLTVSNHGHVIADFSLAAAAQAYSSAEFSVHGNEVLYHHITS